MLTTALRLAWAAAACASVAVFAAADAFQEYDPEFPLFVSLVTAEALQIAAALLTMLLGARTHRGYELFMPFRGGPSFVAMQAFGFATVSCAIAGPVFYQVAFIPVHQAVVHGPLAACGALSALGNLVLLESHRHFDRTRNLETFKSRRAMAGEVLLVFVLAGVSIFNGLLGEYVPGTETIVTQFILALHVGTGLLIHVLVGWKGRPGFRLFSPFAGSIGQSFERGGVWTLWAGVAILGLGQVSQPRPFRHSFVLFSLATVSSNLLLLWHTRRAPVVDTRSSTNVRKYGRSTITTFTVAATCGVWGIAPFLEGPLGPSLRTITIIVAVAMFVGPPLTQVTGKLSHPAFDIWHPFDHSGRDFLLLQGLGWSLYTIAGIIAVVELRFGTALFTSTLALLAQCSIHGAIRAFTSSSSGGGGAASPPAERAGSEADDSVASQHDEKATAFRNELLAAVSLALLSLLLRSVCDLLRGARGFPERDVIAISGLLWALAVPIAHVARSDKAAAVFRPFQGSAEYVALQAVGWTFYALCVMLVLVSTLDPSSTAPRGGHNGFQYVHTTHGLFLQIPFCLVAASSFFDHSRNRLGAQRILEAVQAADVADVAALRDIIGGRRGIALAEALLSYKAASNGASSGDLRQLTTHENPYRNIAWILVTCLGAGIIVMALAAEYVRRENVILSIVISGLGLLASAGTFFVVHMRYGPFVHGAQYYKAWMPFSGGTPFVVWQMCAGTSFAVGLLIFVFNAAAELDPSKQIREHATGIIPSGLLLGAAPPLMLVSLSYFERRSHDRLPTVFEQHAEGIMSVLIFGAAWTFTAAFDFFAWGKGESWGLMAAPLVMGILCVAIAVPLAVVAFRKRRVVHNKRGAQAMGGLIGVDDDEQDPGSIATEADVSSIVQITEYLSLGLFSLVPLITLFALHFLYYRLDGELRVLIHGTLIVFAIVMVLMLASVVLSVPLQQYPSPVTNFLSTWITWALYLSLFSQAFAIYAAYMFMPPALGAMVAANALFLMFPAPVRFVTRLVTIAVAGWEFYQVFVDPKAALVHGISLSGLLLVAAYHSTFGDGADETGSRMSPRVLEFLQKYILWGMAHYFTVSVIRHDETSPQRDGHYMFGYHPHGQFPLTAVWMQHTRPWIERAQFTRRIVVHGASIIFSMPIVRDISLAFGGCSVTRRAIENALGRGWSSMIVPGGQAEMINSRDSWTRLLLTGHHKGFIRLAVEHRVPLVPVFAFGEHNIMDNVHWPTVQSYFLRMFGFGFPVVPLGRWWLPLPCPVRITIVVGRAMDPFEVAPALRAAAKGSEEFEDAIDVVAKAYFGHLIEIAEAHKAEAGYPDLKVEVTDTRPPKRGATRRS